MPDLLVSQSGGKWVEPVRTAYLAEDELQELLGEHPSLIPGVSADAATCRESTVGTGYVDLLAVEPTGQITLVECKLAKNPQVRREVIGQLFDYASHLWEVSPRAFADEWQRRTGSRLPFDDPGGELGAAVAANLRAGRFRLVLAVDEINPQLRRIVEYLNALTTEAGVVAVEYLRYQHGDLEILTPRRYGLEQAQAKDHGHPGAWTLQDYREWVLANEPDSVQNFDALVDAMELDPMSFASGSGKNPSGQFVYTSASGGVARPLHLFTDTSATVELNFADWLTRWQREDRPMDAIDRVKEGWRSIEALQPAMDTILDPSTKTSRRSVPLASFAPDVSAALADDWQRARL